MEWKLWRENDRNDEQHGDVTLHGAGDAKHNQCSEKLRHVDSGDAVWNLNILMLFTATTYNTF